MGARIAAWGSNSLLELLEDQAVAQELSLRTCGEKFTITRALNCNYGWRYHSCLGFAKKGDG
ncbi:hypothetical protein [Pseudolysobacter antarcticus]|uniref:hypothetical protein n=1 Tax=Pseudolysobacter antarcticus TaxID=2511995 RepID=UPI001F5D7BF1|nr:hypothetical protein [Pseudolysobacter antarcticus]